AQLAGRPYRGTVCLDHPSPFVQDDCHVRDAFQQVGNVHWKVRAQPRSALTAVEQVERARKRGSAPGAEIERLEPRGQIGGQQLVHGLPAADTPNSNSMCDFEARM